MNKLKSFLPAVSLVLGAGLLGSPAMAQVTQLADQHLTKPVTEQSPQPKLGNASEIGTLEVSSSLKMELSPAPQTIKSQEIQLPEQRMGLLERVFSNLGLGSGGPTTIQPAEFTPKPVNGFGFMRQEL